MQGKYEGEDLDEAYLAIRIGSGRNAADRWWDEVQAELALPIEDQRTRAATEAAQLQAYYTRSRLRGRRAGRVCPYLAGYCAIRAGQYCKDIPADGKWGCVHARVTTADIY